MAVTLGLALVLGGPVSCAAKGPLPEPINVETLPKPSRELQVPQPYHLERYDNGLTLLIVPDPFTRLVQVDMRQAVGDRDDPPGKSGLAHLIEHLMFALPSEGPDSPAIGATLTHQTLYTNATTSMDNTHYVLRGWAEDLETYMRYTAARIGADCHAIPETRFLREREVVRNEHRWREMNELRGNLLSHLYAAIFPKSHPYRRDLSKGDTQLVSITQDDTCTFIQNHYTAERSFVIVSGNVDPAAVKALAERYFAPLPESEAPPRRAVPSAQALKRVRSTTTLRAPVPVPMALVLYPMPPQTSPEATVARIAQENARISLALFGHRGRRSTFTLGSAAASFYGVSMSTKDLKDLDSRVLSVLTAIERGLGLDLSAPEKRGAYDATRQQARHAIIASLASLEHRAAVYADYLEAGHSPEFYHTQLGIIDDLTPDQVQYASRRLFTRDQAYVVKLEPDGHFKALQRGVRDDFDFQPLEEEKHTLPDTIRASEAHKPLDREQLSPPEVESLDFQLENGMNVIMVRSTNLPVFEAKVIMGAGRNTSTISPFLADLAVHLYRPRREQEAVNIIRNFNFTGGVADAQVSAKSTTISTRGLSIYLDFLLAGLSEYVIQGEYQDNSLEDWKENTREALKDEEFVRSLEVRNQFLSALYGAGHPHARQQTNLRKHLRSFSRRDLEDFRRAHHRAGKSTLILTGGFDLALATQYVEAYFGAVRPRDRRSRWHEPVQTQRQPMIPEPKPEGPRVLVEIERLAPETEVTIGYPLATVFGPDHPALEVLVQMLDFEVRSVREELGASYATMATLHPSPPRIEIHGTIDNKRSDDAMAAILAGIQRLRDSTDFERRFAFARRQVLSRLLMTQADAKLLANALAKVSQEGLGYGYLEQHIKRVATLTPGSVLVAIENVLASPRQVVMLQGPERAIHRVLANNPLSEPHYLPEKKKLP